MQSLISRQFQQTTSPDGAQWKRDALLSVSHTGCNRSTRRGWTLWRAGCGTIENFDSLALGVLSRVSGAKDQEHQTGYGIPERWPTGRRRYGGVGVRLGRGDRRPTTGRDLRPLSIVAR